ncbi:hypothetical protein SEA_EVEPICKLES_56 [Arthrobacter phage EvePickles]|nr:hypothetical protein SEA_EVEPICKLES_56 [Arthrobacter phage EvePickles]
MTALAELLAMVDGLDETGPNFRVVRAMKRLAHTVETEQAAK